ncbi:MAG: TraR/DksA family transcriptional regulator [Pseudomonadota bacterium]
MDQFDRAQELEQQERDAALARQASRSAEGAAKESAKWCEAPHCGERIPDARREAIPGVQYCVECQGLLERHGKLTVKQRRG